MKYSITEDPGLDFAPRPNRFIDNPLPWMALAVVVMLVALSGCALTPRQQWAVARQTLTTTENGLVGANRSGLLPDKDFIATEPFVKASRGALKEADDELTANHDQVSDRFRFYLNLANTSLKELAPVAKAK